MNHPRTRRAYARDHGIAEMRRGPLLWLSSRLSLRLDLAAMDGNRTHQGASTAPRKRF